MEKIENQMMTMPYHVTFDDPGAFGYGLDGKKLILDTICVYGLKDTFIQARVQFDIKQVGEHLTLYPRQMFDKYLLRAERIMTATVLKIDKGDYITMDKHDGSFTFLLADK